MYKNEILNIIALLRKIEEQNNLENNYIKTEHKE